jgi:hypothetical protein
MADKKSAKYPHKWPDGTWHSIPWEQTERYKANATPNPPPGTYDPNLDSQAGASQRGLRDLLSDIGGGTGDDPFGTQRGRAQNDFTTGLGQIAQGRERNTEDYNTATGNVNTGYQRNLSDLLQARTRGGEDYGTNVQTLQRNYQNLGTSQAGQQRKAGVSRGGAAAQAAAKRQANEGIERAPIDTAYQRFMQDSTQTEGRLGEDKDRSLASLLTGYTRGDQDLTTQGDRLALGFTRQDQDWTTQLERAKREAGEFGRDITKAKVAQFMQNNPDADVPYTSSALSAGPKAPALAQTLTAGPGVPGTTVKKRKKKGQTFVTYTNSVTGP